MGKMKIDKQSENPREAIEQIFAKIPTRQQVMEILTTEQRDLITQTINDVIKRIGEVGLHKGFSISLNRRLTKDSINLIVQKLKDLGWTAKHDSFHTCRGEYESNLIIDL